MHPTLTLAKWTEQRTKTGLTLTFPTPRHTSKKILNWSVSSLGWFEWWKCPSTHSSGNTTVHGSCHITKSVDFLTRLLQWSTTGLDSRLQHHAITSRSNSTSIQQLQITGSECSKALYAIQHLQTTHKWVKHCGYVNRPQQILEIIPLT